MRFDLETADYLHLAKPEAAFPPYHFSMLADGAMYEVRGAPHLNGSSMQRLHGMQVYCSGGMYTSTP